MLDNFSARYWGKLTLVIVFLTACSVNPVSNQSSTIIKSANDSRDYRYIELPNRLRVLLVSDSDADKAAASLDVHVGSGQDPKDYQGLAHFLEHMLFLGTEKYPQAGEYQAFINAHGGRHNAYTSFEHTNYFFDIDAKYLVPALDRFSQFFVAPLFNEIYVDREKNAVHSEYMAKIKTDQRKGLEVFKTMINQQHPFSKFSVGNLDTLAVNEGENLRQELIRFYDEHYSASIMTLVVLGRESLSELESIVTTRFSGVANNNKAVVDITDPLFNQNTLPLLVQVKPEQEQRTLSIVFPTEEEVSYYRQKPLSYLGNIIGHEGQGSLLSFLKKQGWAEGLSAGTGLGYAGGATFNITIKLTPDGVSNIDPLMSAVYQTINRIRQSSDRKWLFDEQQAIAKQQFRFKEKSPSMQYVLRLASDLQYFDVADVLSGAYLMENFDGQLIERFMGYLQPDNSFITLTAPEAKVEFRTHFYQTDYGFEPVTESTLNRWKNAGLNPEITLPVKNPFIAESFSLKPNSTTSDDELDSIPELLVDEAGLRVWFKQSAQFAVPKGSLRVKLYSPIVGENVQQRALLDMLTLMVSDELNEYSYPAALAGLGYSLRSHSRGLSININGFDNKQELLLDEMLQVLLSPGFDSARFIRLRKEQMRKLSNGTKQQPYKRAMQGLSEVLYRNRWSDQQLLGAYQSMTLDQLKAFKAALLVQTSVDVLFYGNYDAEQAGRMAEKLSSVLLNRPGQKSTIGVTKLPEGQLSLPVDTEYSDAVALLYIQASDTSIKRRAAMGVTGQLLQADFYTRLRTEKQLGYIVTSGAYPVQDVPGLFYLVQSPVAGVGALSNEIEGYLASKADFAQLLSEQEFDLHRDALVTRLSERPKNVNEQAQRYWQDINQSYFQFNFREQLITALEELTLVDWQAYFTEDIVGNGRRALWLYGAGQFADDIILLDATDIDDLPEFKSSQPYYIFP